MADSKLTALTATSVQTTDIAYVVTDPSGSPASKKATVADFLSSRNSGDIVGNLQSSPVAVTTHTTLTSTAFEKMHYITMTSNITITLPSVTANTNKTLGICITSGATGLATLSGTSIDGLSSRAMWSAETAILECTGTGWRKVSGRSIPMTCTMHLGANQSGVVTATMTKANIDTTDTDNTGMMADTTNKRINIKRDGNYDVSGTVPIVTTAAANRIITQLRKNTAQIAFNETNNHSSGSFGTPLCRSFIFWSAGDTVEIAGYQDSGSDGQYSGNASLSGGPAQLTVTEVPTW